MATAHWAACLGGEMKILKKILCVIGMITICTSLFAQNEITQKHIEKGKVYETQKKWIHALGEYYDALENELPKDNWNGFTEWNGLEAYASWEKISNSISNGNPGIGEFDDFDFVDNWIALLQEYEQYWTENCPRTFYFEKPTRTEINREKKTANYLLYIGLRVNYKYEEINDIIMKGFKKAYKEDWNMPYLKKWPEISVYNTDKTENNYLIDGTALASRVVVWETGRYEGDDTSESVTYTSEELAKEKKLTLRQKLYLSPKRQASLMSIPTWKYLDENNPNRKMYNCDYWKQGDISLYDIKFRITDKQGNTLLTSTRYCPDSYVAPLNLCSPYGDDQFPYQLNDVDSNIMKLIESDEVEYVIDEVYLKYGKIDEIAQFGNRAYLDGLSEIRVNSFNSITWNDKDKRNNIDFKNISRTFSFRDNSLRRFDESFKLDIDRIKSGKDFTIKNYIIKKTGALYGGETLRDFFDYNKLNDVYYYLICNKVSESEGLDPVYKILNIENNFDTEIQFFVDNYENIICDTTANGYRLPTSQEVSKIQSSAKPGTKDDFTKSDAMYKTFILRNKK